MSDEKFAFTVEVGRAGYELELRHGRYAWEYAEKLAIRAGKSENVEDEKFWRAVANHLKPRASINQKG